MPPAELSHSHTTLPTLSAAAPWLARFTPPFEFGSFFSPEDTVLCALATRAAARRARAERSGADPRSGGSIVELTSGSALVLGAALLDDPTLRGFAAETDPEAVASARRNVGALGLADRTSVDRIGLFSSALVPWLRQIDPTIVACNPPYVPEPPSTRLALVAGAGPRGDRHPRRVLRAAAEADVARVVLSWCSLGDPNRVMRTAARAGYRLERLWVAAIADGEYTGGVHDYLHTLPTSYHNESPNTLRALGGDGGDGGVRFAYLLLAGSFVRDPAATSDGTSTPRQRRAIRRVARLMDDFRQGGVAAIERMAAARPPGVALYLVDRWDELRLRMTAHGRPDDL